MAITRKRIGGATRDEQGNTTPVGRSGSRPVVGGSIGRNSSTRGGVSAGVAQNDITSNYSDILARLAGSSDNSILQLLQSLGINQDAGLTVKQRDDWNKQLLDTLINYQLTQENRSYNESMRDEQRLYDTPLNQLARLMGAGVSRDAAIQMLSGGSQPIQSDVAVGAEGIAPSESAANGIQAALAPAQLAIDAIGSVGSLISLGFSIPQAIQQTKFLKNQNLLTQKQLRSYDSASSAFSVLNSIGASKEAFGSAGAAIKFISSAAQKGNIQAQRFMSTPEFATLSEEGYFTSRALSQLYQNERSHESYGAYIQHQLSENKFLDLNSRKVISEMALIGAEINNYVEDNAELSLNDVPPVTIGDFLENASLLSAVDSDEDGDNKVVLMTVHASKGLEFPYVYVAGMEENLFPSGGFMASEVEREEERRLFYVAMTRAKRTLGLSFASTRFRNGKTESNSPSRFVREVDSQYIANPLTSAFDSDDDDDAGIGFGGWKKPFASRSGYSYGQSSRPQVERRPSASQPVRRPEPVRRTEPMPVRRPQAVPKRVPDADFVPTPILQLKAGQRIEHNRFGFGKILEISGSVADLKAKIAFDDHGEKILILKYAKIRAVDLENN